MVNLLYIILGTIIVTIVGGSIGYVVWLKTRPKKETYNARIYQLGEGVIESLQRNKGVIDLKALNLKLRDMRPFATDVIERVEKEKGLTIFRLQRLNKPIESIDGCIEIWGQGKKEITVLKVGDTYTALKKAYNEAVGEMIFHPMPHSRINTIKNEMAIRKDRLHSNKDILQAITPWIVAGICMIGLVCLMYIGISGMVKMSDNANDMAGKLAAKEAQVLALEKKIDALMGINKVNPVPQPVGEQPQNKTSNVIPMIE